LFFSLPNFQIKSKKMNDEIQIEEKNKEETQEEKEAKIKNFIKDNPHSKLVFQIIKNQEILLPTTEEENKIKLRDLLLNLYITQIIFSYYLDFNMLLFFLRIFHLVKKFLNFLSMEQLKQL
jgi:hypothetical protein